MKADVIVIGSGAGGATIARELSKQGKSVAVLEWGKNNPPESSFFSNPFRFLGGMKLKSQAMLKTENEPFMEIVRCITTGGSTLAYGGVSWDPIYKMFEKFEIDLKKEVEDLKKEIIIKPLDESQMGSAAKLIDTSARELGYGWEKIDRLFSDPEKFEQTSYFFGDNTGARWDAREWILDAVKNGAKLYNETFCDKVLVENGKVFGVEGTKSNGKKIKIMADKVVVAAGGIGSPEILKKLNIDKAGKDIFVDPYFLAIGYMDKKISDIEVTRQAGILLEEDGISMGDSALPVQPYRVLALKHKKYSKIFKKSNSLSLLVEIDDDLSGEVGVNCKIKKPLSKKDYAKLEKGKEIAYKILKNAGAKDIWFTDLAAVHPGGACKIGSVVDSNLETEVKNLYVCDASVIPESTATPPVLTILALAKRLAKHIVT